MRQPGTMLSCGSVVNTALVHLGHSMAAS